MSLNIPVYAASEPAKIHKAAEDLYRKNFQADLNGCLPSGSQSIVDIYEALRDVTARKSKVVVFAFDAISFDYFSKHMLKFAPKAAQVGALTSVFPSTTASAWPSILTGAWPAEHGVYGTSFRLEGAEQNYIWISNTFNHGDNRRVADDSVRLNISDRPTVLSQLKLQGWKVYYNGNHGQGDYNPMRAELTKDTEHFVPSDYPSLKYKPQQLIDCFLECTEKLLHTAEPTIIWNYYDLDDFIHEHGYDELQKAVNWRAFFDSWQKLVDDDTAVLLMTDHGQTSQHQCIQNWLRITKNHPWFSADTGGAGRVLYFYPKPEFFDEALKWLKNNMRDSATILTREQAFNRGLFGKELKDASKPGRVGDIIAIAKTDMFISAGSDYISEHGALTQHEMVVPFMIQEG